MYIILFGGHNVMIFKEINLFEDVDKKLAEMKQMENDFNLFKERKIKAKDIFTIKEISKNEAYEFVRKYHYLGDAKFFCVRAFGLFYIPNCELVGCATFSLPQGVETLKSWFNLDNQTKNVFELSRLCMTPSLNNSNATSFLLGGSIKCFKKENNQLKDTLSKINKKIEPNDWACRGVITLACSERHVGSIYQVCNFKYYGMTKQVKDFYCEDGRINPRGKTGSMRGVYLPRSRKYRYAYILDASLKCNYKEQQRPQIGTTMEVECCHGTHKVYDDRFNQWYTCPRCTGKLDRINSLDENNKE